MFRKGQLEEWRPEALDIARSILVRRGIFPTDLNQLLNDPSPGDEAAAQVSEERAMDAPPPDYSWVATGLDISDARRTGELLTTEDIPFFLQARKRHHSEVSVYVPVQHAVYARMLLEREGILPNQPPLTDAAVGAVGGPCPACGCEVAAGSAECPNCGLALE